MEQITCAATHPLWNVGARGIQFRMGRMQTPQSCLMAVVVRFSSNHCFSLEFGTYLLTAVLCPFHVETYIELREVVNEIKNSLPSSKSERQYFDYGTNQMWNRTTGRNETDELMRRSIVPMMITKGSTDSFFSPVQVDSIQMRNILLHAGMTNPLKHDCRSIKSRERSQ